MVGKQLINNIQEFILPYVSRLNANYYQLLSTMLYDVHYGFLLLFNYLTT